MEQNKSKCIECMDKIKRKLNELGYSILMTNNKENILCKVSDVKTNNYNTELTVVNTGASTVSPNCPYANNTSTNCPYSVCKYPSTQCHKHGSSDIGNNATDSNTEAILEAITVPRCSLFRIRPDDIYTGLFLHVVKLHGEICELKMSFEYNDSGVAELISVINFLVKE